jgi:hypothetical protein
MRPGCVALLVVLTLGGGLGGCGADDELSTDIPRTSPDLTIPTETNDVAPVETTTATTSTSTSTTAAPPAAAAPAATPPPVAAQPQAPPPASTTGGAGTGGTGGGSSTTGGAAPGDPAFDDFCRDNPGAGPPC